MKDRVWYRYNNSVVLLPCAARTVNPDKPHNTADIAGNLYEQQTAWPLANSVVSSTATTRYMSRVSSVAGAHRGAAAFGTTLRKNHETMFCKTGRLDYAPSGEELYYWIQSYQQANC